MSSLLQKLSDQTSSSNEQQLLKISGIIDTGETHKFKKKGNEEHYKLNAKVMAKLDEAEQSVDSANADNVKEKLLKVSKKKGKKKFCLCVGMEIQWFIIVTFLLIVSSGLY